MSGDSIREDSFAVPSSRADQCQHFLVLRNIRHTVTVMDIADPSFRIDDHLGGHPPQLEDIDLLAVQFQNRMLRIRKTDKRKIVLFKVLGEPVRRFRSDDHNNGIFFNEPLVFLAQLRHVLAAEGSEESPVHHQENEAASKI